MFVVRQLQGEGTKGLLILIVEGHSLEQTEEQVLAHLQRPAGEMALMLAFGKACRCSNEGGRIRSLSVRTCATMS
jgi:hypothetical protein